MERQKAQIQMPTDFSRKNDDPYRTSIDYRESHDASVRVRNSVLVVSSSIFHAAKSSYKCTNADRFRRATGADAQKWRPSVWYFKNSTTRRSKSRFSMRLCLPETRYPFPTILVYRWRPRRRHRFHFESFWWKIFMLAKLKRRGDSLVAEDCRI